MQGRHPVLAQFTTAGALKGFFDLGLQTPAWFEERDRILRSLLAEHRATRTGRTHEVFIHVYAGLLGSVTKEFGPSRRGKSLEVNDVAPEVVLAFLHVLATLDAAQNRDVHTSLVRRTRGQFLKWANKEYRCAENTAWERPEETSDTADTNTIAVGDLAAARTREPSKGWELDVSKFALDELHRRGVIDDINHHLLLGKVVYQERLKKLVTKPVPGGGRLTYAAAQKRLWRVQEQIRDYMSGRGLELQDLAKANMDLSSRIVVCDLQKPQRRRGRKQDDSQNKNH